MDLTRQSVRAQNMHSTMLASGEKTCIDCHKGIAHKLPDMAVAGTDGATR
jgi:cytochrome c-type protein NapC